MIPAWPILGSMDPFLARQLGWTALLLSALVACSSSPDASPSASHETARVDLQLRPVIEVVPASSTSRPTCGGQQEPVGDCVASNHDADRLVLVGPEPPGDTYVLGEPIIDGSDVLSARALPPQMGSDLGWTLALELTPAGTLEFGDATARLLGQQIATVLEGAIVSAPTVAMPVTGGSIAITGSFGEAEARSLASLLNPATDPSP
jgi:preprotein translocase subunit SecD